MDEFSFREEGRGSDNYEIRSIIVFVFEVWIFDNSVIICWWF